MSVLVDILAVVSLLGIVMTGFWSAAFGLGLPLLLLTGVIDRGGRPSCSAEVRHDALCAPERAAA